MKFNLLNMKKEREEYDINAFNLILNDIYEKIKETNKKGKNSLHYSPNYSGDENIELLNAKWDNKKIVKEYMKVLEDSGLKKVKIKRDYDINMIFEGYCLYIEW